MSEPLGLFPLPLVLVPTERIPLHIFEDRYRELIGECLEEGTEFGFVLATGDGAVHEIGTRAWVAEVLDELDDGRMNIVVEGRERFRLLELTSGRSFTTGLVEAVVGRGRAGRARGRRAGARAVRRRSSRSRTPTSTSPAPDAPQLDFELAARVDFGVDAKQELLATTSPRTADGAPRRTARAGDRAATDRADDARARQPQRQDHPRRSRLGLGLSLAD